jgi:hypothetical protein
MAREAVQISKVITVKPESKIIVYLITERVIGEKRIIKKLDER